MINSTSPFKPNAHVAAYLRDSGGDEQDLSVAQQESVVTAWCTSNHLVLAKIYRDIASPGSSVVGRADFLRMISDLRSPGSNLQGIIIWKYSRFSRDIDDAQFYKADLRRRGLIIHSLNDQIPDGLNGRFFESALDWMNAKFLEDLSIDVKRGLHHLVKEYGCVPGTPPFGFIRQPVDLGKRRDGSPHIGHRWVPDPTLIPSIQLAYQLKAAGIPLLQILKQTGIPYSRPAQLSQMFKNKLYKGVLVFGDLEIQNYCQPVVDENTWSVCQPRHLAGDQPGLHPRRVNSSYLLSGLIHCTCGAPLIGETITNRRQNTTFHYYACNNRRQSSGAICHARPLPKEAIEAIIINELAEYILEPTNLVAILSHDQQTESSRVAELEGQRKALLKQLQVTGQRLSRIADTIADAGPLPNLIEKNRSLLAHQVEIETELARLTDRIASRTLPTEEILENAQVIRAALLGGPDDLKRNTLRAMVQSITAERVGNTISGVIAFFMPMSQCPHGENIHTHKFAQRLPRGKPRGNYNNNSNPQSPDN